MSRDDERLKASDDLFMAGTALTGIIMTALIAGVVTWASFPAPHQMTAAQSIADRFPVTELSNRPTG